RRPGSFANSGHKRRVVASPKNLSQINSLRWEFGDDSDRFDGFDLGHVVADQALDAAFERDRRGGAAGAGAVHREIQVTVLVPLVDDVAAVLRDRRADASLDELLSL